MRMRARLYPRPRHVALGQVGTGWLGLVSSWVLLGFGAVLTSLSGSGLADLEIACAATARVCGAASWGGVTAGVTSLGVALLFSLAVARGFGPPVRWWIVPVAVGTLGTAVQLGALLGEGEVSLPPVVVGLLLQAIALILAVVALGRDKAAVYGWVRLDGLDAREVRVRAIELLLPVAAVASASAGGAFAAHVARLLASG